MTLSAHPEGHVSLWSPKARLAGHNCRRRGQPVRRFARVNFSLVSCKLPKTGFGLSETDSSIKNKTFSDLSHHSYCCIALILPSSSHSSFYFVFILFGPYVQSYRNKIHQLNVGTYHRQHAHVTFLFVHVFSI